MISDILGMESYELANRIVEMNISDSFRWKEYTIRLDGLVYLEYYTLYSVTLLKDEKFVMRKLLLLTKPRKSRSS